MSEATSGFYSFAALEVVLTERYHSDAVRGATMALAGCGSS
jgi:hypothetical protein